MSKRFQLTPEQLALSEQRKAKKAKLSENFAPTKFDEPNSRILSRKWVQLPIAPGLDIGRCVKVLTWNLLAQCLVRRELFPTSDCLKAAQREHMIYNEILSPAADIMCLQEVDRLDKLLPVIERAGYSYTYAAGPGKKHGCLIAYNKEKFTKVNERVVRYDEEEIRSDGDDRARRGCSFRTKNIGSLLALKRNNVENNGIIVATTHLFWHPKYVALVLLDDPSQSTNSRYTYERASSRQAGILVREVVKFRNDIGHDGWPCLISGDFNFAPDDPAYSLLVGDQLLPTQENRLAPSRVVHFTVDPDVYHTTHAPAEEEEAGNDGEIDPDKIITNARPATPSDGLLTTAELADLYANPARSAYDEGLSKHRQTTKDLVVYCDRVNLEPFRRGANEPEWTSYTHYWKTVLGKIHDYIFILDPPNVHSIVTGFSQPPRTEDLDPGIPRKGVCGSDHVSLCAEIMM
ncbi:hypothetical protein PILCRDRAFT_66690 [Piloderma croceum F 1598]|uniref:Endonuclease/exonuclease/phosphatase domain-containing protein n=1 Tax=Piloderma croceum (strain F 1598) TaxID=765440 RepID=A0A0C3FMJ1_PILCF|nr:hypothetical protein PILCRDRAFT_66690 [Piloderma croceum F 1598]